MPYFPPLFSGSSNIPERTNDPIGSLAGFPWLLDRGAVGIPGQAMGTLGLTYARQEIEQVELCVKMNNGLIKRVVMI